MTEFFSSQELLIGKTSSQTIRPKEFAILDMAGRTFPVSNPNPEVIRKKACTRNQSQASSSLTEGFTYPCSC